MTDKKQGLESWPDSMKDKFHERLDAAISGEFRGSDKVGLINVKPDLRCDADLDGFNKDKL